ncbi:hypothetical protein CBF23_009595 [Marinomonas agarivorans]|nr:hypothetical protein CBF23_009595 [Marinomonas agarivorans]
MLRSFFVLVGILLFPMIAMIFVPSCSPITKINNYFGLKYLDYTYDGVFILVEDLLVDTPEAAWQAQFDKWQQGFGYQVRFIRLNELNYSASNNAALIEGKSLYLDAPVIRYVKRLSNSDWVMEMSLEQQENEDFERSIKGARLLIEQVLRPLPQEQWREKILEMDRKFSLDVALHEFDTLMLELTEEQQQALRSGQVTWRFSESGGEQVFYWNLFESNLTIAIGPIEEDKFSLGVFISFLFLFFLMVASAIFAWLYPLWLRLKRLDEAAIAFGQGELDQRVKVKRYSITSRLGKSFNLMAERIQTLIQTNQELTNAIAHDLRTPLAKIRFAIEMLDADDSSQEEKQNYKKSVNKSIDNLNYLLNQILIYSRYNRIADASNFTPSRFANVVQDEVEEQQFLHEKITFLCDIDTELQDKRLVLDKFALARALTNLLTNAAKFASTRVRVTFTEKGQYYYLVVEDDGLGIAEEKMADIFEPFKQIDNDERNAEQGHGLGLAIVSQIAKWHQGEVWVEDSAALGGAKFTLRWPVSTCHISVEKT